MLVLNSHCEGSNATSFVSPAMEQEGTRPVGILNNFGEKKSHLGFIEKLWQMTMHH